MCMVSMVQDWGQKRWPVVEQWTTFPNSAPNQVSPYTPFITNGPTRAEFEQLKAMVEAAQKIDVVTGQPDCEKQNTEEWLSNLEARMIAQEDMNLKRWHAENAGKDGFVREGQ